MTDSSLPGDPVVIGRSGPWALRACVTASCTRCGTMAPDDGTGFVRAFASASQAREELTRDQGWLLIPPASRKGTEVLLCPDCAADPDSLPEVSAAAEAGRAPWWKTLRQSLRPSLPATASLPADPGRTRDGG